MSREGLEEWLKWGTGKIRHLERWKVVGKVRPRKRQKDNLLRVMKHFFQIKNHWHKVTHGEVEGIGGCSSRQQVDCYCILANVDWVLVVLMPLHILQKHPANSTSPTRQRCSTNQLLQKLCILYSSYRLQLKAVIPLMIDFFDFENK